jgi:pimeloyl-ACP methyl ester carboxylesterase
MGTTRFAQNDLARLAYEISGPATGPVVVALHATLAARTTLDPLRARLDEAARVIAPDARGHGASSALQNRNFSPADMANDVVAILDAEGVGEAVHFVGHGQGAIAALELAHWRPDRIASLVLIEPDAVSLLEGEGSEEIAAAREDARKANRQAADDAYKNLADKALNGYLDRRWGSGWRERLPKPRLAAVRRNMPALAASLDALDRFRILPEHLAGIASPVLLVTADDTPAAERHIADRLAAWMPAADRHTAAAIPGGMPLPDDLAAAIATWLRHSISS